MAKDPKFSVKTFKYFDGAETNKFKKPWYEANSGLYLEGVKDPFSHMLERINQEYKRDLPKMEISSKKITRPLRPSNRAEEQGHVKNFSFATLCEKNRSRFEWNPAIHIQFGAMKEDNLMGIGIYMVSSRQMSRMRAGIVDNFDEFDQIMTNKKMLKAWGGLAGEKYKRFPKAFDPGGEAAKYLWHKQFFMQQIFTRTEVKSKEFTERLVADIGLALPFMKWLRKTVGVYR